MQPIYSSTRGYRSDPVAGGARGKKQNPPTVETSALMRDHLLAAYDELKLGANRKCATKYEDCPKVLTDSYAQASSRIDPSHVNLTDADIENWISNELRFGNDAYDVFVYIDRENFRANGMDRACEAGNHEKTFVDIKV